MASKLHVLCSEIVKSMGVEDLIIPTTAVKFYRKNNTVPSGILKHRTEGITLTSCQALRQASLGDVVCLTRENIGCVAAAISFGLVDQNDDQPMDGNRVYTDIMKDQSTKGKEFSPPTPKDFTSGIVYGCRDAEAPDFCLFGDDDVGRFPTVERAAKAVSEMTAIQPADVDAVFFYSPDFDEIDVEPDVIVFSVRPVELARLVQAYQFETGERIEATMGAVRVVNSDLIVRPYLSGKINVSSYCVGARLIAQFEPDRLGMGVPFSQLKVLSKGMKDSETGYPFHLYPGASE